MRYLCKYRLPQEHRTDDPSAVPASVIHQYLFGEKGHDKGKHAINEIGKLKTNLNGEKAVGSVMSTFESLHYILDKYQVEISEKEIIKRVVAHIEPETYKDHLGNVWVTGTARERESKRDLEIFHDVLVSLAETAELHARINKKGYRGAQSTPQERYKPALQRRQALRQQPGSPKPLKEGRRCFKCGSTEHGVLSCPHRTAEEKTKGMGCEGCGTGSHRCRKFKSGGFVTGFGAKISKFYQAFRGTLTVHLPLSNIPADDFYHARQVSPAVLQATRITLTCNLNMAVRQALYRGES